MNDTDGVIGLGDRFSNIEAALARIELKLDNKVGYDAFNPLVHRVEQLEAGETPLGRVMLEQFTALQRQVNDLTLHGSQQAQQAQRDVVEVEKQVAALAGAAGAARAVNVARQRAIDVGLALLAAIGIFLSAGTYFH